MKVAIVGAGKLGLSVTEALMGGGYEVMLIDQDSELLQKLSNQLDLLTVEGNAKDVDLLKSANIHTYDFLAAVTDNDEKHGNMFIGQKLGAQGNAHQGS